MVSIVSYHTEPFPQAYLRLSPEPQLPNNVSSPNIARIFGTSTSAFELLVLKRKIMGPCWLQIKEPHIEHKGVCLFFSLRTNNFSLIY